MMLNKKLQKPCSSHDNIDIQDKRRIIGFLLSISFTGRDLSILERSDLFHGILEVLDWSWKQKITENELEILYSEWQKTKNIQQEQATYQYIDLLIPTDECLRYFSRSFPIQDEIPARVQRYQEKVNEMYNQNILQQGVFSRAQMVICEQIYVMLDDEGVGYIHYYQLWLLYAAIFRYSGVSRNSQPKDPTQTSLLFTQSPKQICNFNSFASEFTTHQHKIPLKSLKNVLVNWNYNESELVSIKLALIGMLERANLSIRQFYQGDLQLESFNLHDAISDHQALFHQNQTMNGIQDWISQEEWLLGDCFEDITSFGTETRNTKLAKFQDLFLACFSAMLQDPKANNTQTTPFSSNSNIIQVQHIKTLVLPSQNCNLNNINHPCSYPVSPSVIASLERAQTQKITSESSSSPKYSLHFNLDDSMLQKQPSQRSQLQRKSASKSKSPGIISSTSNPILTQSNKLEQPQKIHHKQLQEHVLTSQKHMQSHSLKDLQYNHNKNKNSRSGFERDTSPIGFSDNMNQSSSQLSFHSQIPNQPKSPYSQNQNKSPRWQQQSQRNQHIQPNKTRKNPPHLDNSPHKYNKNLSPNNTASNYSKTPSARLDKYNHQQVKQSLNAHSKSPPSVRTHADILKTKRIESYENVMKNLNNLQHLDLTPRKINKPFM